MKNFLIIPALAAVLAGCATSPQPTAADYSLVPAVQYVVTVTCSDPTTKFSGTIVADGQSTHYSGIGKGSYPAAGHVINCSFRKTTRDGQIILSISEAGKDLGYSTSSQKFGGVRAEISDTNKGTGQVFSTF